MQEVQMTVPQRKALVDMLDRDRYDACLWRRVRDRFASTRDSRKQTLLEEHLKGDEKYVKLTGEIKSLRAKLTVCEEDLRHAGFKLDEDGDTHLLGSHRFLKAIDKRVNEEIGSLDDLAVKFDLAKILIWTVGTAAEAQKIVEDLQNVQ